jgi:hypothetical protein
VSRCAQLREEKEDGRVVADLTIDEVILKEVNASRFGDRLTFPRAGALGDVASACRAALGGGGEQGQSTGGRSQDDDARGEQPRTDAHAPDRARVGWRGLRRNLACRKGAG